MISWGGTAHHSQIVMLIYRRGTWTAELCTFWCTDYLGSQTASTGASFFFVLLCDPSSQQELLSRLRERLPMLAWQKWWLTRNKQAAGSWQPWYKRCPGKECTRKWLAGWSRSGQTLWWGRTLNLGINGVQPATMQQCHQQSQCRVSLPHRTQMCFMSPLGFVPHSLCTFHLAQGVPGAVRTPPRWMLSCSSVPNSPFQFSQ